MKIGFLGCGSMGSIYAGYLSQKNDVYVFDIAEANIKAVKENGITLEETDGQKVFHPTLATTNPEDIGVCDLMICFVKYLFLADALRNAHAMFDDHAMLLTLQNGIGNTDEIMKVVPASQVLCGTTAHGGTFLGPGHVQHNGVGITQIGAMDPANFAKAEEVAKVMEESGLPAEACEGDPINLVWHKLFSNIAINAITAMTGGLNKIVVEDEDAHDLAYKMVVEAITVANANGGTFDMEEQIEHAFDVATKTGENHSSMLQDFMHERRTEIDIINGAVVKLGKKAGVPTPYNETLVDLVRAKQNLFKK